MQGIRDWKCGEKAANWGGFLHFGRPQSRIQAAGGRDTTSQKRDEMHVRGCVSQLSRAASLAAQQAGRQ